MKVLVDTSIWSMALHRRPSPEEQTVAELAGLIRDRRVQIIGPIRQEILSGVRHEQQFERLKRRLDSFPNMPIETEDYVTAAQFFNQCRARGVQGSNTDFLICAVSVRLSAAIFTSDQDFDHFAAHLPISVHRGTA